MTRFNYFQSDVLPFALRVKDGERRSQSHSKEYDWLGPDNTQNTRGKYILIFPEILMTLTPASPDWIFYLYFS